MKKSTNNDWNSSYEEYCQIMKLRPNLRDEIIFLAGRTFQSIETNVQNQELPQILWTATSIAHAHAKNCGCSGEAKLAERIQLLIDYTKSRYKRIIDNAKKPLLDLVSFSEQSYEGNEPATSMVVLAKESLEILDYLDASIQPLTDKQVVLSIAQLFNTYTVKEGKQVDPVEESCALLDHYFKEKFLNVTDEVVSTLAGIMARVSQCRSLAISERLFGYKDILLRLNSVQLDLGRIYEILEPLKLERN